MVGWNAGTTDVGNRGRMECANEIGERPACAGFHSPRSSFSFFSNAFSQSD